MQYYTEQNAMLDPLTDSDGDEFNKVEDGEGKQQYMFIWSPKYEVGRGHHRYDMDILSRSLCKIRHRQV